MKKTILPSDALAVAKTIPPGPIGGDRHMALVPEACIRGLQKYMDSLSGPAVLTEEQQATISSAQHANTVRATIKGQTDRRWEVWGPVTKSIGLYKSGEIRFRVDSKLMTFYEDKVMSYPQLIVWALEMRRMMGIRLSGCRRASSGVSRRPGLPSIHEGTLRRLQRPGRSSFRMSCNQQVG
jgi:hypothetical protein